MYDRIPLKEDGSLDINRFRQLSREEIEFWINIAKL